MISKLLSNNKSLSSVFDYPLAHRTSQMSPEKQTPRGCTETRGKRLVWRIDSHNWGGWDVPRSAICKLEVKECQWCKPKAKSRHLRTGRPVMTVPAWGQRAKKEDHKCPRQERMMSHLRQKANLPFLHMYVLFGTSVDWGCPPPTMMRAIVLTQSVGSNSSLFWKHP